VRVLVVEGESVLAGGIKRGLEAEGFAVDVVGDGPGGLQRASEGVYDVIVVDSVLSGLDGYCLCSSLREAGNWTPLLMVSTTAGELDEAKALDGGADDFVAVPFANVVLVARIRALVRRGGRKRPPTLDVGDLRLNPAAHRVWRGEVEIPLTPRQFSLLEYLMGQAGAVVSKAELLDRIWGAAFEGDPNIIEVYIRQLRARIDEPFGRHAIQTVRLVGYLLAADGG